RRRPDRPTDRLRAAAVQPGGRCRCQRGPGPVRASAGPCASCAPSRGQPLYLVPTRLCAFTFLCLRAIEHTMHMVLRTLALVLVLFGIGTGPLAAQQPPAT